MTTSIKLGGICEMIVDCEHKTAPTVEAGYPSIRTPNIGRGYFLLEDVNQVSEETYRQWTRRAVPCAGDLIMAREAPVGNVAMVPKNLHPCLGQRTLLIRPDPRKVDSRYLTYLLIGDEVQGTIHSMTNGATVPHLNMEDVRTLELPEIPPLKIQKRIADILSAYDDLIENNLRRIKLLEEISRVLYREWFVKFRYPGNTKVPRVMSAIGSIPKTWDAVPFTSLAQVLSGGTPKTDNPEYWDGAIPFFTPRDAPASFYVLDTGKHLTSLGVERCASALYPPDTVFITARGTVGKIALPSVPMAMNQSCYALKGREGVSQRFLFLMTMQQVDYLKKNTGGATFATIVVDTFSRMRVARPPSDLLERFTQHVDPMFEQIKTLSYQINNLRQTRDLLLSRLLSRHPPIAETALVA